MTVARRRISLPVADNLLFAAVLFFTTVLLGALQKPLFMLRYRSAAADCSAGELLSAVWHGTANDINVAGYVTALPLLLMLADMWLSVFGCVRARRAVAVTVKVWLTAVAAMTAAAFAVNLGLYGYWRFPLDASVLQFLSTPREAFASLTFGEGAAYALCAAAWFVLTEFCYMRIARLWNASGEGLTSAAAALCTVLLTVVGALDFLAIRGGVSRAVANVSKVYFSDKAFLNHAAVNPLFSFLSSVSSGGSLDGYEFYDEPLRAELFDSLTRGAAVADNDKEHPRLLKGSRPDIVLILAESFGLTTIELESEGRPVAPRFGELKNGGIYFSNMIANASRTDKGTVAVLSGFPAQPRSSVMKKTAKACRLPSIARTLKDEGYSTTFVYGGDINFTNTSAYLYGTGFERLLWQKDMDFDVRPSSWGYADDVTAEYFADRVVETHAAEPSRPLFAVWQTLSSHEPFDVPERFRPLNDPVLNSMAFADECITRAVERLHDSPVWDNLLIIIIADHAINYPWDMPHNIVLRHRIPMLWTGGAVVGPMTVGSYASQTDLAATLLAQLGLPCDDFTFSRDIFGSPDSRFGYYCFNDGFGIVDDEGETVYDNTSGRVVSTHADTLRLSQGKALLQTTFKTIREL